MSKSNAARWAGLMALAVTAWPTMAIETLAPDLVQQTSLHLAQAQTGARGGEAAGAAAARLEAKRAAQLVPADPRDDAEAADGRRYQPYAMALAGALLMAYIGLRRPRE